MGSIFCLWLVVKMFSLQKVVKRLEEVVAVGKRSGEMADEAKLCRAVHSTFEVLVVQRAVGHCHGEELGPFC